jgi:hypothetical protein
MNQKLQQNNIHLEVTWQVSSEPSTAWDAVWQKLLTSPVEPPRKFDFPGVEYQGDHSGRLN